MDLTRTNYCAVCRQKILRPPKGGPWQHATGKPCPGAPDTGQTHLDLAA